MDRGGWLARLCVASRRVLTHVAFSREAHSSNNADFSRVTRLTSPSRPNCPLPERRAGAMLSSKPPPYDSALVVEARESAGKIEGGFWTKSSSAADYESRARKKLETISGQIQRSGTPGETQRAHYEAAMTAQVALLQASAPPPPPLRRTTRSSRRRWICSTGSCRARGRARRRLRRRRRSGPPRTPR